MPYSCAAALGKPPSTMEATFENCWDFSDEEGAIRIVEESEMSQLDVAALEQLTEDPKAFD